MSAAQGDVLYEVNLDVDAEIAADYRAWLDGHMHEMAALSGFFDARLFEVTEPPPQPGRIRFCAHYALRDAAALDAYLRDHAPRMRAQGIARFGDRFRASRRVLHVR